MAITQSNALERRLRTLIVGLMANFDSITLAEIEDKVVEIHNPTTTEDYIALFSALATVLTDMLRGGSLIIRAITAKVPYRHGGSRRLNILIGSNTTTN